MAKDLDKPLRGKTARRPDREAIMKVVRGFPVARTALGLLIVILAVAGLRIAFVNDPGGGRPSVEAALNSASTKATAPVRDAAPAPNDGTAASPAPAAQDAAMQPLTVTDGGQGPEVTVVGDNVPETDAAPGVGNTAGPMPRGLTEKTRYGAIPRVGTDGQTPFAAYARASIGPGSSDGKPLVAIVVTGMGLNRAGTLNAVRTLPAAVTLAFAPYGDALRPTAAAAIQNGHETLLELPMEPFDYPQSDPGPKTLLAGQPARANLDRLFWLLARFKGYMGVMNYMGARFTASAEDFQPVMEELATRGLGYFDDGTSNRSLAPQMAESNKIPFARASVNLDANPSRADILAALSELEKTARDKGAAVGIASALPISIETITQWANGLKKKGLVLVPVSALMKPS